MTHIRTVAQWDALIAELKAKLVKARIERKRMVLSAKAKVQTRDPAFVAKWRAGIAAAWSDPVRRAAMVESNRKAARASGRGLPDMTPEQRAEYRRFTQSKRLTRAEALSLILPGPRAAPVSNGGLR